MSHASRGFARQDRVKEQMLRELAELTRSGLKDPRAGMITLTDIDLARDYSHAVVYYTVLDDGKRAITQEALDHAKGFLRSELSRRVRLFRAPELQFEYDESIERGRSVSHLIEQVSRKTSAG